MLLAPESAGLATAQELKSPAPALRRVQGDDAESPIDPRPVIRQYILQNFLFSDDSAALADDASFLQMGIIDSVGALEIALFLEQTFGFAVKEDEMLPENLDSVDRLANFVESRRQKGGS